MSVTDVLSWIYNTPLGVVTRESQWLFATFESLHFIGLSLLIGAMLLVDLRLIGVIKSGSGATTLKFTHVAMFGFALILISGIAFVTSNPAQYLGSWLFQIKLGMVFLGLLNVLWFEVKERPHVLRLADGESAGAMTKVVACGSLACWLIVIGLGRFLPVAGGN